MQEYFEHLSNKEKEKLSKKAQPNWTAPMMARLSHEIFSDKEWIFERKLDGERCLAFKYGQEVNLKSRNNKNLNTSYPEIVKALSEQAPNNFILDGEIVAFRGNKTSFSRLQGRMQIKNKEEAISSRIAVYYYIFDLLHLEDYDITKLPLRVRKKILKTALNYNDPIRLTFYRNNDGAKFYNEACRKGWEGLIAKDAQSNYIHNRSSKWLKFKCVKQQEFVIGGYTEPHGERIGFGAILIGYYKDNQLRYAGKVGTGFDDETLERLKKKMKKRSRKPSPFRKKDEISEKQIHWITPGLVAEIGFTEWTGDNKLRHPRYLGLRRDKDPSSVHKET